MNIFFYVITFVLIVACDLLTKLWAFAALEHPLVINKFLSLQVTFNTGVAWSLFAHAPTHFRWLIMAAIIAVVAFLIHHMIERWHKHKALWGEVIVLGGACGNIIDRFWHGAVVDFIVVHYKSYVWPVFNVADIAVVCGVFIMLITQLRERD